MFKVNIREKGGQEKELQFEKEEVSIGRVQGNDIILPRGNVSKRHARIVYKDSKFIIVDLRSTNGTYVNAERIGTDPHSLVPGDTVTMGDIDFIFRRL